MDHIEPTQVTEIYTNKPVAGALYMLASALVFASMGALIKAVSQSMSNEMVVFFRNIFGMAAIIPWLGYRGGARNLKTSKFSFHLLRAAAGLGAMYCYVYALGHMKLGEAVLLSYTSGLFIPIVAWIWLKESVSHNLLFAIIIGFAGITLILKPGTGVFRPVAVVGLSAGVLASVAQVTIRRMAPTENPTRIVFYYSLLATIISSLPLVWARHMPAPEHWKLLALIGVIAVTGQLLMTKAYNLAPASRVIPFMYGIVVFAGFYGWLIWEEAFDLCSLLGAILVCTAGILTSLQARKGRKADS